MDQSPISTTKTMYKKNIMRKLLIEGDHEKIKTFLQNLDFQDCMVMLSKAWSSVKQTTLKNAWKKLLGNLVTQNTVSCDESMPMLYSFDSEPNSSIEDMSSDYDLPDRLAECLSKKNGQSDGQLELWKSKIGSWFREDEDDCGWEEITDDKIVQFISNDRNGSSPTMLNNFDEEPNREINEDEKTAAIEAREGLLKFKAWVTTRFQCSEDQHLHLEGFESIVSKMIHDNSATEKEFFCL